MLDDGTAISAEASRRASRATHTSVRIAEPDEEPFSSTKSETSTSRLSHSAPPLSRRRLSSFFAPAAERWSAARRFARSSTKLEEPPDDSLPPVWVKAPDTAAGPAGKLVLTIHSANDLMADVRGRCNPYVVVHVLGNRPWRSKTLWQTTEPVWEQSHEFEGFLADLTNSGVLIKVYSRYLCSRNAFIGRGSVFLRELLRGRHVPFDHVPLERTPIGALSFSVCAASGRPAIAIRAAAVVLWPHNRRRAVPCHTPGAGTL